MEWKGSMSASDDRGRESILSMVCVGNGRMSKGETRVAGQGLMW